MVLYFLTQRFHAHTSDLHRASLPQIPSHIVLVASSGVTTIFTLYSSKPAVPSILVPNLN